jgi:hypothetical protein
MQFLIKVQLAAVRHCSPSEGPSRAFQVPISFADANLKAYWRTSPSRDEGFKKVKGAPGVGQKLKISKSYFLIFSRILNFLYVFKVD